MRPASILLALVVVLGFVNQAGAAKYMFTCGEQDFGIADVGRTQFLDANENLINELVVTEVRFGPLGASKVPFTATQGLVGFCCILATLIMLPMVLTVRWRKKRATA